MIDLDKAAKQDVKQIHYANLWEMVNYCENTNDCRRVLQLQYLGEVFDSRHCNNSGAKCDNCCKGKQEQKDITEFARKLVNMVARLAMRGKFMEKNFTVNHLVDILRESKNKKVTGSNWNTDPDYGSGKYSCKVQLFSEGHKNLCNLPHGFDIYLVKVKTMKIAQIFVAFSENLNFNKVIKNLCTDGKAVKGAH